MKTTRGRPLTSKIALGIKKRLAVFSTLSSLDLNNNSTMKSTARSIKRSRQKCSSP